jgi:FAD/FMN-containing dehydrogenase
MATKPKKEIKLAALVLEYARDMRRNSSGGDDYPWEWAKATADYLEELVRRSGVKINMSHAILADNAQQVLPDRGEDWIPDNPHIAAMFARKVPQ